MDLAGLQTWAADGTVEIDLTTRITKKLGQVVIGLSAGQLNHPGLTKGEPWYFFSPTTVNSDTTDYPLVQVDAVGGIITWSSRTAESSPLTLCYGIF